MKHHYLRLKNHLTQTFIEYEENQYILNNRLINLLYIQKALLSNSYIHNENQNNFITLLSYIARPQLLLTQSVIYSYIILTCSIIFLLTLFFRINNKYINLFGLMLQCNLLNSLFELTSGNLMIPIHIILLTLQFILYCTTQETYNINIINFKQTKMYCTDYLIVILNSIIMIVNSYINSKIIIKIIAFLMNAVNLLNVIFQQNCQSLNCKAIIITIQIFSFYFGIIDTLNLDHDLYYLPIFLVLFSYKVFLRSQEIIFQLRLSIIIKNKTYHINDAILFRNQINLLKNKKITTSNQEDKIILASILIEQNRPFEAFLILNDFQQRKLSFLKTIKVKLLYNICMRKININIQREQLIFNKISMATKEIILADKLNQTIQSQILEIMFDKIQCQNLLLLNSTIQEFQYYLKFVDKVLNIQKTLEKQYQSLPCEKTQNILGFFYSEIMNDFLSAYTLFNIATLSDDKITNAATYQDVFTNKMVYLLIKYDGNLTIVNPSQDASNLLQLSNEFLVGKNVTELVPPGIAENHNLIVEEFFTTGKSRFYQMISKNLIYNASSKLMDNYDFAFDISFGKQIMFLTFIQPAQNKSLEIILNNKFHITCISQQLANELGFQFQIDNYLGVEIHKILPKYPEKIEQNHYIENAEACFDLHEMGQSHQSSTLQPWLTSYYINQKSLDGKCLYISLMFDGFRKMNYYNNNRFITTENTPNATQIVQTSQVEYNSNDEIIDECTVQMPQELNLDKKFLCLPYFVEERNTQSPQILLELNNLTNEQKYEFTNIKSFRSNDGLLAEQQKSIQPISINIDCFPTQNNKQIIKEEEMISNQNEEIQKRNIDIQSQVSTMKGIRKSQYYKKYELIEKLRYIKSNSNNHNLTILLLTTCIIVQLIIQTIQLGQLDLNLKNIADDIDLLQIKNLIYQPFESFIITRWTMINYNAMLQNGQISKQQHTDLFKFPLSNLNMGFDQMESNFREVGDRPGIQHFLENTYLDVYTYISTGIGEPFNVSLRNSIQILLSYQYDLKMRYAIEGFIVTDSPYVFYSYRNYINMKSLFSQLNEEVLQNTIIQSQNIMTQTQSIFIVSFVSLFVIFPIAFHYFLNIQRVVNKFYSLVFNIDSEYVHNEISKLKFLVDKFNKDTNILFKFQFNLEFKEKSFKIQQIKQHGKQKANYNLSRFYFSNLFYYFVFTLIIAIITGNATLTYNEAYSYISKYPATSKFYKAVSDVGTDVPTMFGQRDILYNVSYIAPFLNETTQKYILQEIIDALNRTTLFVSIKQNYGNILISDEFYNYFQNVMKGNLCDHIPDNLKNKSIDLCPIVMESQMQRGLSTILIYIINYISTDMEISHFKNRTSYTYMNLEGAFIVSNIIREINIKFHADLITQTQLYIDQINIHNIILIVALILMILFIIFVVRIKLINKLCLAQHIIYVLPLKNIILNHSFERNLRQLTQK